MKSFESRTYARDLMISMAGFGLLFVGRTLALKAHIVPAGLIWPVAMLPMIGAIAVGWVIVRHLRRFDELHWKAQMETFAVAFGLSALIVIGWNMAEDAGAPRLSGEAIWPIMAGCWILAMPFTLGRYGLFDAIRRRHDP